MQHGEISSLDRKLMDLVARLAGEYGGYVGIKAIIKAVRQAREVVARLGAGAAVDDVISLIDRHARRQLDMLVRFRRERDGKPPGRE